MLEQKKLRRSRNRLRTIQEQLANQVVPYRENQQKLEQPKSNYQKQEKTLYQAYQFFSRQSREKKCSKKWKKTLQDFFKG